MTGITVEKALTWAVRCEKCGWTYAHYDRNAVTVIAGRHRVEGCGNE